MCCRRFLKSIKQGVSVFMVSVFIASCLYIPAYADDASAYESTASAGIGYYGEQACADSEVIAYMYQSLYDYYVEGGNTDEFTLNMEEQLLTYYTETSAVFLSYDENGERVFDITDAEAEAEGFLTEMMDAIFIASRAFIMDHPELFWLESFKIDEEISRTVAIYDGFRVKYVIEEVSFEPILYYDGATDDIERFNTSVDASVAEIEQSIWSEISERESAGETVSREDVDEITARTIHDWLITNIEYSKYSDRTSATVFLDNWDSDDHTRYAICEGLSKAFKILGDRLGITSILVNGMAINSDSEMEQHMWNDVLIGDTWYGMDVSWDNQAEVPIYIYYLTGYNESGFFGQKYSEDHIEDTDYWQDGKFVVEYPVLSDTCHTLVRSSILGFKEYDIDTAVYTGDEIRPNVTIRIMGVTLTEGVDYTLEYKNNINATVDVDDMSQYGIIYITGIGKYYDTKTVLFYIAPRDISNITFKSADYTYTGSAIKAFDTLTSNGRTLTEGIDYTVEYKNNVNVGTATFTVTGIGNYTGTATGSFKITKVSLANIKLSGLSSYTYTGSAIKPTFSTITYGGLNFVKGTDFTISYKNNTNVGTATITVKGIGSYCTGSTSATFKIAAKSISSAKVSSISNKTYTGSAIKPTPTVKVGGKTLKKGTDYTLSYKNNKSTGVATITITGKGNYKGTKTVKFYIVPKKIAVRGLTSPKTKTIKLTWTKNSTVTGYQIQYSTSSKFTNATTVWVKSYKKTSATITKLKAKKKYYVRIRGYKTVSGTKKYGAWATKSIKTK